MALSITQVLNLMLKWHKKKPRKKKRKREARKNRKAASSDAQGNLLSGFYLNNPIQQIEAEFFKTKVRLEKDWLTVEQAAYLRTARIINFNNFSFVLLRDCVVPCSFFLCCDVTRWMLGALLESYMVAPGICKLVELGWQTQGSSLLLSYETQDIFPCRN